MVLREIIEVLQRQSPEAYACSWDNVGLQVGNGDQEIRRVYVALDATDETIQEAEAFGADMLLTHHPMIFKGLKKVNRDDFIGRRVIELIKHDMAYYAMHTNFDIAGMADLAAEKLGLLSADVLQATKMQEDGAVLGFGKVGEFPARMPLSECIQKVKQAFAVETVKVFAPYGPQAGLEFPILRAAVCPGSGKSMVGDALRAGAEVFITGDIDHHEGIDAAAQGMAVIDAGHYGIEKLFIPYMASYLQEAFPGMEIRAQEPKQPFFYV